MLIIKYTDGQVWDEILEQEQFEPALGEVQRFSSLDSSENQLLIGIDSFGLALPEVIDSENVLRYYRI